MRDLIKLLWFGSAGALICLAIGFHLVKAYLFVTAIYMVALWAAGEQDEKRAKGGHDRDGGEL